MAGDAVAILELLGSPKGVRADSLVDQVREGLPTSTVDALAEAIGIQRAHLARLLNVSVRTLSRRKNGRLDAASSDRVLRIARIAALATRVLGSKDKAVRWMSTPNRAMGGPLPVEMLDTDLGTREVESVLGRIGHGVFS
jgi:putative toxin-antitoxin system antitoxin component (TIGR02293 family)